MDINSLILVQQFKLAKKQVCSVLVYHAAYNGNSLPKFCDNLPIGPILKDQ